MSLGIEPAIIKKNIFFFRIENSVVDTRNPKKNKKNFFFFSDAKWCRRSSTTWKNLKKKFFFFFFAVPGSNPSFFFFFLLFFFPVPVAKSSRPKTCLNFKKTKLNFLTPLQYSAPYLTTLNNHFYF